METGEENLKEHYRVKKLNEESKAISHIEEDPANFSKYTRQFSAKMGQDPWSQMDKYLRKIVIKWRFLVQSIKRSGQCPRLQ